MFTSTADIGKFITFCLVKVFILSLSLTVSLAIGDVNLIDENIIIDFSKCFCERWWKVFKSVQ